MSASRQTHASSSLSKSTPKVVPKGPASNLGAPSSLGASRASGAGSRARMSSSASSSMSGLAEDNPFTVPSEEEVFILRDKERQRKTEERIKFQNMSITEKTLSKTREITLRDRPEDDDLELTEEDLRREETLRQALEPLLSRQRDSVLPKEKENLAEYIAKKREMFLVQMSLDAKRSEIRNLEDKATERERKLREDEELLEENAQKFDEFLKDNDMKAVEAMRKAEAQTKEKADKVAEIKRLNAQIQAIKSQMSTDEEKLEEWRRYKDFLLSLTPEDWKMEQRELLRKSKFQKSVEEWETAQQQGTGVPQERPKSSEKTLAGAAKKRNVRAGKERPKLEEIQVDDAELPMYFADPQQLLDIFASLEESNLFLIQNSQETEEALEEIRTKYNEAKRKLETESSSLEGQIQSLEVSIQHEKEKISGFTSKAEQNVSSNAADRVLNELNAKVLEVYRQAGYENDAKLSTLDMLRNIERKLEELIIESDQMDPEGVEALEKAREKERRQRIREEKLEQSKKLQEDRVKRALERSQAPVQKKTGKPVMFRSHINSTGDASPKKKRDTSGSGDSGDTDLAHREDYRDFFQ
eukprot:ANDGO_02278.mRNA.1 hypothetical protein PHYSODRAFT_330169